MISRTEAIPMAALIAIAAAGLGCNAREPVLNATPVEAQAKTSIPGNLELEAAMAANLRVESVHAEAARRVLTATGKVQINEDRTARLLAPLPGQVMDLQVKVGDAVEKDQTLFTIKSREVAALTADYLESRRDADLAAKTYAMTKDLFDHQAASRMALQQAEGDLAKAGAHVSRAEEALRVLGLDAKEAQNPGGLTARVPVLAPLSGNIMERAVTAGQFVQADSTPLLTIADLKTVWVLVDIFERDIHLIRIGQKVQITAAAYPDRRFTATVERIHDRVDPETRTLKVRLLVANPGLLLKAEMFLTASVELNESANGIPVPAAAVFTEGGKSFLFVAQGERQFERRLVTSAPDGEGRLRVTSGLRTGDRVVTDGALLLNSRRSRQPE